MKISILCSAPDHPVNPWLERWRDSHSHVHTIEIIRDKKQLSGGDLLFLISCSQILTAQDRAAYAKTLVIHASDVPLGRGWSPHIWQILEGKDSLTVSLLEAADEIDAGDIWHQIRIPIAKDFLFDEINRALFDTECELMDFAVTHFADVTPHKQDPAVTPTYYRKRTPTDSEVDPAKSLAGQFNLIRVCDPDRFPAFFSLHGKRYKIKLEKIND